MGGGEGTGGVGRGGRVTFSSSKRLLGKPHTYLHAMLHHFHACCGGTEPERQWYKLTAQGGSVVSVAHVKNSSKDCTTSSASSLGSRPVILPTLGRAGVITCGRMCVCQEEEKILSASLFSEFRESCLKLSYPLAADHLTTVSLSLSPLSRSPKTSSISSGTSYESSWMGRGTFAGSVRIHAFK